MTASADQEVKPMLLAHRKPEFLWAGQPASGWAIIETRDCGTDFPEPCLSRSAGGLI